jgi:hypothetical protein
MKDQTLLLNHHTNSYQMSFWPDLVTGKVTGNLFFLVILDGFTPCKTMVSYHTFDVHPVVGSGSGLAAELQECPRAQRPSASHLTSLATKKALKSE